LLVHKDKCPDGLSLGINLEINSIFHTIAHKSSKLLIVYFIGDEQKKILVEFKMFWELDLNLMDAVKELNEHW
jgi:hypothetical protein